MSPGASGASSVAGGCSICPWTPPVLQCTTRLTPAVNAGAQYVIGPGHVDRAIGIGSLAGCAIAGGDVVDNLHALTGRIDRPPVSQVTESDLDAIIFQHASPALALRSHQPSNREALTDEKTGEVPAGEAGDACHESRHKTFERWTGEPSADADDDDCDSASGPCRRRSYAAAVLARYASRL